MVLNQIPVTEFLAGDLIRLYACGWQTVMHRAISEGDDTVVMVVRILGLSYAQDLVFGTEERFDCMRGR